MKWFLRALVLGITYLSADLIAGAGEPKPNYIRWPYGIVTASLWTVPLWMSTLKLSARWRLVVAPTVLLTGMVTSFAMLGYNAIVASTVAAIHLFLIAKLIAKNKNEEIIVASQAS